MGSVDLEHLEEMIPYSYYYENVFSLEDLYLYRAVYHFYKREYPSAISDYLTCQNIKLNGGANNNKKFSYLVSP